MKLATMITIAAIAVMPGAISQANAKSPTGRLVTICSHDDAETIIPVGVEMLAQDLTSKNFADIGVTVRWHSGCPSRPTAGTIAIELVSGTPAEFMPGSMAYALPYEGVHIQILWDRIRAFPAPGNVLAHVLTHEIAHILQGGVWHSKDGIMKAHWTRDELLNMKTKPLSFTSEDAELISRGLDNREARAPIAVAKPGQ